MNNKTSAAIALLASVIVSACATGPVPPGATPIDQVPMYGPLDRNAVPELKAADERLIRDTTSAFGSREKASAAWVEQGFAYYYRDDLVMAMRRFNQAWLLNPQNPEVYWGFASVLYDRGQSCEAAKISDMALEKDASIQPAFYPDAGVIYASCGAENPSLSAEVKQRLERKSEDMFSRAVAGLAPKKEYTLSKWIVARYSWGDYAGAWSKVREYREATGKDVNPRILARLREKMPEPR